MFIHRRKKRLQKIMTSYEFKSTQFLPIQGMFVLVSIYVDLMGLTGFQSQISQNLL